MYKGWRFVGEKRMMGQHPKMNFHTVDKNGRLYWCGCLKGIRLRGKIHFRSAFWQKHRVMYRPSINMRNK